VVCSKDESPLLEGELDPEAVELELATRLALELRR
jgi:hypothetical protein